MDKLHTAAMALIEVLEDIRDDFIGWTPIEKGDAKPILAALNSQLALLSIAKGQLEWLYDCYTLSVEQGHTGEWSADVFRRKYIEVSTQLASIPGDTPKVAKAVAALKEALSE